MPAVSLANTEINHTESTQVKISSWPVFQMHVTLDRIDPRTCVCIETGPKLTIATREAIGSGYFLIVTAEKNDVTAVRGAAEKCASSRHLRF